MARAAITIYLKSAIESGFDFIERRFGTLSELNRNFHSQRNWIFEKLEKKADYKRRLARVLEVLKMHSCKYLGISFLTENHLCEAYEGQFRESISKRTVNTYIKHLRELGFITTFATKREDGKQTANIVVIERFRAAGEKKAEQNPAFIKSKKGSEKLAHKDPENLHTKKTTSSFKTTIKEIKERCAKELRLLNFIPKWFKEQIACYSKKAREVYEYWKVTKHLMNRTFGTAIEAEEKQAVVRSTVREFFLSAKAAARGKFRMHNPYGFFHAVLKAEGYAYIRRKGQASSTILYNWLEV